MLWRVDSALTLALDVAEAWLGPIDYLATLWPCPSAYLCFILRTDFNISCSPTHTLRCSPPANHPGVRRRWTTASSRVGRCLLFAS